MPGSSVTLTRFPIHRQRFTLANRRSATGYAAIAVRQALKSLTYSVNPLSFKSSRPATEKHCTLVNKLWTIVVPCGKLRKTGIIASLMLDEGILPFLRPHVMHWLLWTLFSFKNEQETGVSLDHRILYSYTIQSD
jgi:hypothetical protein